MDSLRQIYAQLRHLLSRPTHELTKAQRTLRYSIDLTRHCARELQRDRAEEMAAALTYRTIFSLVPTIILALIVFQAFGGFDEMALNIKGFAIEQFSPHDEDAREAFLENFLPWYDQQFERIANLSIGGIGTVGLAVLIWAALALVVTVERCFNRIYKAPSGRPWHLKIPIYWAVITLGPVLIAVSLYLVGRVMDVVNDLPVLGGLLSWMTQFAALGATWLLLFLVYMLMPNMKVRLRYAMIGAFVAAIISEIWKWAFKLYVTNAVGFSQLYGTLGLVPLFLFWVYVTWLTVLFGLEMSYTLQAMDGRQFDEEESRMAQLRSERVMYDPRWLLPIMAVIGDAFVHGKPVRTAYISRELRLPTRVVAAICERLREQHFLHIVSEDKDQEGGYTLARPPSQIRMAELLDLGETMSPDQLRPVSEPGREIVDRLHQAQLDALGEQTLECVVSQSAAQAMQVELHAGES